MTTTIPFSQWHTLNGNHVGIQTLEDLSSAYVSAEQDESTALFRKGEVMLEAVNNRVVSKQDAIRHCASLSRRTRRCVADYYLTAEVFPEDRRNPELHHSLHTLCAKTDHPYDWLEFASREYVDENGELKQHTWRTLKEAIQASGGRVEGAKLRYLIEAAPAEFKIDSTGRFASLTFDTLQTVTEALRKGLQVKVWIAVEESDDGSNT